MDLVKTLHVNIRMTRITNKRIAAPAADAQDDQRYEKLAERLTPSSSPFRIKTSEDYLKNIANRRLTGSEREEGYYQANGRNAGLGEPHLPLHSSF